MKNQCQHERTRELESTTRAFTVPVARHPYTEENRAAHGNIVIDEQCLGCGAIRAVAINQHHYEYGPWGPSRAEREEQERERRRQERIEREKVEDAALAEHNVRILDYKEQFGSRPEQVLVKVDGQRKYIPIYKIEEAANQQDNGDGLVPFYSGLLRLVNNYKCGV